MAFPIAAAAIAAGAQQASNLIGSGLSYLGTHEANKVTERIARDQMAQQKELYNQGLTWSERMTNEERAYNSPDNQRRLIEQAGYSPWVLTESNLAGSSQAASAPGAPSQGGAPSFENPFRSFENLGDAAATFGSVANQFADVSLKNEQAYDMMVRRAAELDKLKHDNTLTDSQRKYYDWLSRYMDNRAEFVKQNDMKNLQLLDLQMKVQNDQLLNNKVMRELHESGIRLNDAQIIQSFQQVKTLMAQAYAYYQSGNESASNALLAKARTATENAMRSGQVKGQDLRNQFQNVMLDGAIMDLQFNQKPFLGMSDNYSNRDFENFMNLTKKAFNTLNPLSGSDAGDYGKLLYYLSK